MGDEHEKVVGPPGSEGEGSEGEGSEGVADFGRASRKKLAVYVEAHRECYAAEAGAPLRLRPGDVFTVGKTSYTVCRDGRGRIGLQGAEQGALYADPGHIDVLGGDGFVGLRQENRGFFIVFSMLPSTQDWLISSPIEGLLVTYTLDGSTTSHVEPLGPEGIDFSGSATLTLGDRGEEIVCVWDPVQQQLSVGGHACVGTLLLHLPLRESLAAYREALLAVWRQGCVDVLYGNVAFAEPVAGDNVLTKAMRQSRRITTASRYRPLRDDALADRHAVSVSPVPGISLGVCQLLGGRLEMEDRVAWAPLAGGGTLLGVFDGHGGDAVAERAARAIEACHTMQALPTVAAWKRWLEEFFDAIHRPLEARESSTGATALVLATIPSDGGWRVVTAGAGDCRALCIGARGEAIRLSFDHKAIELCEAARVFAQGGYIDRRRVGGTLAPSRSLGDHDFSACGMTCLPEISVFEVPADALCLLVATDGFWDEMDDADAAAVVTELRAAGEQVTARRLAERAVLLGSEDNVSVVVAILSRTKISD